MPLWCLIIAATQRNLSPEDTDLIEITLATLFGLDRLIHLLRIRSEALDLVDLRLTWEDNRADSYASRSAILSQAAAFLTQRARWKAEHSTSESTSLKRGHDPEHNAEDDSALSWDSQSIASAARQSYIDEISRECLVISSSIASLKETHVASSGKVLDELIDASRKPVPDAMLDEQDRVEKLCDQDLVSLGRFLQQVVMQFKTCAT